MTIPYASFAETAPRTLESTAPEPGPVNPTATVESQPSIGEHGAVPRRGLEWDLVCERVRWAANDKAARALEREVERLNVQLRTIRESLDWSLATAEVGA